MATGNTFMDMISRGINNTKPEGVMMARDDRIGTLMNLLEAERMSDNPDLDKIREYEGELFNLMSPRKAADGGIMYLAPGGEVLKKTIKTPSTYGDRAFEDFLMDADFTKKDPDTKQIRGSKGKWNAFLKSKGITAGSDEATDELNKILKSKKKPLYISVNMAQSKFGKPLVEEITGTVKGQPGADLRNNTFQKLEEVRLDANDKYGRNPTKKKYKFIEDQILKFFPKVAGTTALAQFITGKALGFAGAMMPSELEAATLYDDEGNMKEGIMSQIEEQNKMKVITE